MFSLLNQPGWQTDPNGISSIQITNPAAATDFTYTVPAGTRLILLSMRFVFTTDANVANRQTRITFDDGTNIFLQTLISGNLAAGNAWDVGASQNFQNTITGTRLTVALGICPVLLPAYRIKSVTVLPQVGDQYSAIWMQCIRQTH